ncbi:MAG: LIC_13387 family protein [Blastocatellia bacterium]
MPNFRQCPVIYTFSGPQLKPRDPALQITMSQIFPVLTRETTMWKAWVGFNASHSMGLILFGLIYGYLALVHSELLFKSHFLLLVGLAMVGGLLVLGKVYWFSVPFWSICVSFACYIASVVASRA